MVRVVLGGDGLDGYSPTEFTDQYVNVLFVPPGAPYSAPFDIDAARAGAPRPSTNCDWHLMVGDESAIPAIATSLEHVAAGAPVVVVALVDGPDHELQLSTPGDARIRWVHRSDDPGNHGLLLDAVEATEFPSGVVDVFVHGEATEVRAVRKHLLVDRGVPRDGSSISPYWRRRFTDEAWREVKSAWLADVQQDA